MGSRGFFPTNPDLADVLGRTDFDVESLCVFLGGGFQNLHFLTTGFPAFPKSVFPEFQKSGFPDFQKIYTKGRGQVAWKDGRTGRRKLAPKAPPTARTLDTSGLV